MVVEPKTLVGVWGSRIGKSFDDPLEKGDIMKYFSTVDHKVIVLRAVFDGENWVSDKRV